MFDIKKLKGKEVKKDSNEYKASKDVLNSIKKAAEDKLTDGLKKVTVAAPDKKSLLEGMDVAKDIMKEGKIPMDGEESSEEGEESAEHEAGESKDFEAGEQEEITSEEDDLLEKIDSEEEIDALLAKLQEKKAALKKV